MTTLGHARLCRHWILWSRADFGQQLIHGFCAFDVALAFIDKLREHKARVPSLGMWDSVYNEAQFTLEPYLEMADAAEKRAAQSLLDALKAMAAP